MHLRPGPEEAHGGHPPAVEKCKRETEPPGRYGSAGDLPDAGELLLQYDWPGNVRELQNATESAMNQCDGRVLRRKDFRQLEQRLQSRSRRHISGQMEYRLRPAKQAFERELIRDALAAAGGNRVKAAELLGISRTVLYEKLEKYQIK